MNTEPVIPTILLVEEDFIFALSLQVFLKGEFNIIHSNNFEEAVSFLQRCKVDGCVIDVNLRNTAERATKFIKQYLHGGVEENRMPITFLAPDHTIISEMSKLVPTSKSMSIPIDYELFRMLLIKQYFGNVQHHIYAQRA